MSDLYVITSERDFNGKTVHHTKFCYTAVGKDDYLIYLKRIEAIIVTVKHYREVL